MTNFSPQEGEIAFDLHTKIVDNEQFRRKSLWQNIQHLKQLKDTGLYKAVLGDEKADWVAYLGQIETFYTRSNIYGLTRIYDKFVEEFGMNPDNFRDIPKSRLLKLLLVVNKDNAQELLDKARVLTSRDFNDEIRALRGLLTTDECEHEYKTQAVCKHCGKKYEVTESVSK